MARPKLDNPRSARLQIRCTPEERERFIKAAGGERMVSRWIVEAAEHFARMEVLERAHFVDPNDEPE